MRGCGLRFRKNRKSGSTKIQLPFYVTEKHFFQATADVQKPRYSQENEDFEVRRNETYKKITVNYEVCFKYR